MPDSFTTQILLDGRPALLPLAGYVNTYHCPRGAKAGTATVLLARADVDAILSGQQAFHTLSFSTGGAHAATLTFPGMVWVSARRLLSGTADDPQAAYLVQLKDRRHLLERFSDTGTLRFNLRSFAQRADYLSESSGYSWASAIEEVWETMETLLGPFPGLPESITPNGSPENLHFLGTNAWATLHTLLTPVGCTTAYDPQLDKVQIVDLAEAQTGLPPAIGFRFDDQPQTSTSAAIPEKIRVYFHTHYRSHGQERDTQLDANFLEGAHSAFREVSTGDPSAIAGTVLPLWDDLPQVLDEDNQVENDTELTDRAQARAAAYLAEHAAGAPRRRIYPGLVETQPGTEVAAVTWSAAGPGPKGTTTEVVFGRAVEPVGQAEGSGDENYRRPDLARRTTPGFPSLINAVQAWDIDATVGELIPPNADGLIAGRVVRWVAGTLVTLEDCWLRPVSLAATANPQVNEVVGLRHGDRFVARLSGIETSGDETLPLYLVQSDQPQPTGAVYWGACLEDKTEWDASGCTTVSVRQVDSCHDQPEAGTPVEVVLPRISDVQPNLQTGSVIAFSEATDRQGAPAGLVCVSDYTKSPDAHSFAALWGEVEEDVTQWNASGCTTVSVTRVADCSGTPWPDGPVVHTVLLPRLPDKLPRLESGDIIAYIPAPPEGLNEPEHVIVSDYTIGLGNVPQWGVCLTASQDGGAGGSDTVLVQPTLDRAGQVPDPQQGPVTVYLPRRAWFLHSLREGEMIAFEIASDGSRVIQSDYSAGPRTEDACLTDGVTSAAVNGPERVQFDQRVGFRVGAGLAGARSAGVTLVGGASDRLWQAESSGEPPQWSDTVFLGRLLGLGGSSQPGAVVWNGTVGLAGPESALGSYVLVLPDEQPDAAGRVLFVTDWKSDGASAAELGGQVGVGKLRFSRPGISGSATVEVGDLMEFESGICVKWEDSDGVDKVGPPTADGEVTIDLGQPTRGYLCPP